MSFAYINHVKLLRRRWIWLDPVSTKFFVTNIMSRNITSTLRNRNWTCLLYIEKKSILSWPMRYDRISKRYIDIFNISKHHY